MAGGPGGREVGRISIRVAPDTSRFDSELRAYLKSAEAKHNLTVDLDLDTAGFRAEMREATAEAGDVELDVDANTAQARSEISSLMRDRRRVNIELNADTERLRADIAAATRGKNRVEIAFDPNVRALRRELAQLSLRRERLSIALEPDVRRANIALAAWRRFQEAQPLTLAVQVSRSSLNFATGILAGVGKGSAITLGVAGIGSAVLAAAALVDELSAAAGFALLIPAALGGLVGIGAAAAIAFEGIGDALSAVMSGDLEALGAAVANLAPSAQEAVTAFAGLREELGVIRESVQQNFFDGMAGEIENLSVNLLPALERGLGDIGAGLGDLMEQGLETFGDAGVAGQIQAMFSSIGRGLSDLRPAVDGVIQAFTNLGVAGSTWMPQLVGWVNELSTRFSDWTAKIASDGSFDVWVQGAIGLFEQLGSIAGSIGGIFDGLGQAADGASLSIVGSLDSGLQKFDEFVQSTEGQEFFATLFEAAKTIGAAVLPILSALKPVVEELAPYIADLATAFGDGLAQVIEDLGPELGPLIDSVVDLVPEIADLAVEFGELAIPLIEKILPHLPNIVGLFLRLLEAVEPLVDPLLELVDAFVRFAEDLLPALEPIVDVIAEIIRGTAKLVDGNWFGPNGALVSTESQEGFVRPIENFGDVIGKEAWEEAGGASDEFWVSLKEQVDDAVGHVKGRWSELPDAASNSWGGAESAARTSMDGIDEGLLDNGENLAEAKQRWADLGAAADLQSERARLAVIGQLVEATRVAAGKSLEMAEVIRQNLTTALGHTVDRIDGMRQTIERGMAGMQADVQSRMRAFVRIIDAQYSSAVRAVKGRTADMTASIEASMARLQAIVSAALRRMSSAIVGEMRAASYEMLAGGRRMVASLQAGLSGVAGVARAASNRVVVNLRNSGAAYDAGAGIGQGFERGIRANVGGAIAAAVYAADRVAAEMRRALAINSPSKVAEEIGKFVMEGLALGLERNMGLVDRSADHIADRLQQVGPRLSPLNGLSGRWSPYRAGGGGVNIDVHPAPGMDEEQLATATANEMAWRMT